MPSAAHLTPIRRVQTGWAVVTTTSHLMPVILFVLAYQRGGAALLAGGSVAMCILGTMAASWVGAVVDRFGLALALRGIIAAGSTALVACAITALAGWPTIIAIICGSVGVALLSTYRPIQAAALPWLVHTPRELARANVGAAAIESVASLVGPALAGAALFITSPDRALVVGAFCAVVAPIPLLGLRIDAQRAPRRHRAPMSLRQRTTVYAAGPLALWTIVRGGGVAVLTAAQTFGRGALQVLLVLLVLETLGAGDDVVGWLWAAMGVGGVLGAVLGSMVLRYSRLGRSFVLGVLLWGVGLIIVSAAGDSLWTIGAGMLVVGFGNAVEDASMFTFVARVAPRETVVRALSAIEVIAFTSMAIGSVVAPGLADLLGDRGATLWLGIVIAGLALAYVGIFRAADRRGGASAVSADLLADVAIFQPLPVVVVEHLARQLERHAFDHGAVAIREGDAGDSFHIIEDGRATVRVNGAPRPDLGPGEGFGEIALLRDTPRTATVTAEGPLTTLSLDREVFLTAICGHASAAEAIVESRLAGDERS